MMRFVTVLTATLALATANPANIFEIDITPEEAQKYLNSPPFVEPQLSGRTGILPLVRWNDPRFRAAEAGPTLGHYWKNGHEIENTDDYVEEVYDASQYHGQDGLGAFAYGYQTPESSKVENRARSGDVTGSYTYKDGNNELIKVRYWADSEGFHQEDNRPKVELQPAQETEDVRQARLAHEKAWQEAAAAAAQQPDPQGEYSPAQYEYQPHPAASEQQAVVAQVPVEAGREGKAYYSAQAQSYQGNQKYQGGPGYHSQAQAQGSQQQQTYSQASAQYQQGSSQQQYGQQYQGKPEEPEPTGPPRGFFYSFNYPVSIIVPKNAGGPGGPINPGHPVDHDTVGINAQRG